MILGQSVRVRLILYSAKRDDRSVEGRDECRDDRLNIVAMTVAAVLRSRDAGKGTPLNSPETCVDWREASAILDGYLTVLL